MDSSPRVIEGRVNEKYTLGEKVGGGHYGDVYIARRKSDGAAFCCKIIDYCDYSNTSRKHLDTEITLFRTFNHKNIPRCHDIFHDAKQQTYAIVMDYYENGDLSAILNKHKQEGTNIEEDTLWRIMIQLLRALIYCHSVFNSIGMPIIHRDIKPKNILIGNDGQIKLADFGLSRIYSVSQSNDQMSIVGTYGYSAPEINTQHYNEKVDIWSLGSTMYELATKRKLLDEQPPMPYPGQKLNIDPEKIVMEGRSEEFHTIVCSMLTIDSTKRPNASSIINFPIIQDVIQQLLNTHARSGADSGDPAENGVCTVLSESACHNDNTVIMLHNDGQSDSAHHEDGNDNVRAHLGRISADNDPQGLLESNCVKREGNISLHEVEGDTQGGASMISAVIENDIDAVVSLMSSQKCLRTTRGEVVNKVYTPAGRTALMTAAIYGRMEILGHLVRHESRMTDDCGMTALMYAILTGHRDAAQMLAKYEAGIIACNGETALIMAAAHGQLGIVKLLIDSERGMQDNNGYTALMLSAERGYNDIVHALISYEAKMQTSSYENFNGEAVKGRTALMRAACAGHVSAVKLLAAHEKGLRDSKGRTALHCARACGQSEVTKVLSEYPEER